MNTNNFITMAVALVVGILLISGVVVPVIASTSSDSGDSGSGVETDITGFDRYAKVTDSTDVTIYPYFYNDTHQYGYSYTNPYEPDAQIHIFNGGGMVMGDGWMMNISASGSASDMVAYWVLSWEGAYYFIYELHLTGNSTVATGDIAYSGTQVTLDLPALMYYPSPDGQFVNPVKGDGDAEFTYLPYYANSNSEVFCIITCEDSEELQWVMCAVGTISNNTAWLHISFEEVPYTDSVAFTIEDGIVTGATVTVDGNTYEVSLPSQWEEDGEESTIPTAYGYISLLPVSVYEGGGSGGSGMSSTLTTILSVIPLILTVGLVLGAVGFLRTRS